MRFGIMSKQLDTLVPKGGPPEQLAAGINQFTASQLIGGLASAGFKLVELDPELVMFFPAAFSPRDVDQLARLKQDLGLSYTVHLPLWSVEPSTPMLRVREGSVHALVEAIQTTLPLEPEVYTLHATGALAAEFSHMQLPDLAHRLVLDQFMQYAIASIGVILESTGLPCRKLAVETIEFPFERILHIAETMDTSITLDTGHILAGFSGPIDLFDALDQVLPRLAEVHLHDSPWQGPDRVLQYGQDHRALGHGDLDVARFLDRLTAAGFDGPLIMELTVQQALESLERIRALRPNLLPA